MKRTFYIANFGCRASQSEGASIQEELLDGDSVEATAAYDADVVVVNSCTVTAEADREVRQTIRRIASRNPRTQIIVTGCYAQRAPQELSELPQVRYVVGNSHKSLVGGLAQRILNDLGDDLSNHGRAEILCSSIFLERELPPSAHLGSGGRTRAVVKVQDGCNANCSFCIIPSVRGRSRSMPPEIVVQEIRALVKRGYKEVVLSGIHLGTYGRDLEPRTTFFDLLCSVLTVDHLERIRMSSIEPLEVTPEIIELAASNRRVAHHFHVPLQSGSAKILRSMYRPYAPAYYAELVDRIRIAIPDASIGADVMVGFPGESDEDFRATYQLVEKSPLTYLHVFPFSPRPGTVAADLLSPVPDHVVRHRSKILRRLIAGKNESFRSSMLGRDLDVLIFDEEPESGTRCGISGNFIRVRVAEDVAVNEWTRMRVTGLDGEGLQASKTTTAHDMS